MNEPRTAAVQVTYMELRGSPAPPIDRCGTERIAREHLSLLDYLTLYRNVGEPLRWDQRLLMPEAERRALLEGKALNIYVLRDQQRNALGLCEFDRSEFPEIELKNFGLVTGAQRRGLGATVPQDCTARGVELWCKTDMVAHGRLGPSRGNSRL